MVETWRAYRLPIRRSAHVDGPLLLQPYPQRQRRVEYHVHNHRRCCVVLGALKPKLIVPEEAGGGDEEGSISKCQAHVGQGVGLSELEGVEVVGNRIVGSVLQVSEVVDRDLLFGDGHVGWAFPMFSSGVSWVMLHDCNWSRGEDDKQAS